MNTICYMNTTINKRTLLATVLLLYALFTVFQTWHFYERGHYVIVFLNSLLAAMYGGAAVGHLRNRNKPLQVSATTFIVLGSLVVAASVVFWFVVLKR